MGGRGGGEEREREGGGGGWEGGEQPDWKVTAVRDFQLSPATIAHIVLVQRVAGASTGLPGRGGGGGGEGIGDRGAAGYHDAVSMYVYKHM